MSKSREKVLEEENEKLRKKLEVAKKTPRIVKSHDGTEFEKEKREIQNELKEIKNLIEGIKHNSDNLHNVFVNKNIIKGYIKWKLKPTDRSDSGALIVNNNEPKVNTENITLIKEIDQPNAEVNTKNIDEQGSFEFTCPESKTN
jgi:hypothetical protein